MNRNFYFKTQADIVSGSRNFANLITADPSSLGLTPEQAANYSGYDAALQSAYAAASKPESRTSVAVRNKNDAIKDVQREAQCLANIISATPTVDDAQLMALGLLPRAMRTRRTAPLAPPIVNVISVVGRLVRIHIRAADGARRPIGAAGAQIYSYTGEEPPTDGRQYHHEGLATRGTFEVQFPNNVAGGATAWISAGWVSTRGVAGLACAPVSMTIQGGPVVATLKPLLPAALAA
jgi:hypothetical protein